MLTNVKTKSLSKTSRSIEDGSSFFFENRRDDIKQNVFVWRCLIFIYFNIWLCCLYVYTETKTPRSMLTET